MADKNLPTRWTPSPSHAGADASSQDFYGYPEGGSPRPGEESLLRLVLEFLALLRRNALLVILTTAAALGIAIYRVKSEQAVFRAGAVIRITDRSPLGAASGAPRPVNSGPTLLSQIEILQSRAVAREVADQQGLRLRPATRGFAPALIRGAHVDSSASDGAITLTFFSNAIEARGWGQRVRGTYRAPIDIAGVRFTISESPLIETAVLVVVPLEDAASEVLGQLRGSPRGTTDIIDVSYIDHDPIRAQRIVNSAITVFQAMDARVSKQASVRRREFIEQQLQKAELQLNEAQIAQNKFRSAQQVASVHGVNRMQQNDLAGLASRRQELQAQRAQLAGFVDSNSTSLIPGGRERLASFMTTFLGTPSPLLVQAYNQLVSAQGTRDSLTTGPGARAAQDRSVQRSDLRIAVSDSAVFRALRAQLTGVEQRLAMQDELKQRALQEIATLPEAQVRESGLLTQVSTYQHEAEALRSQLQAAAIDEAAEAGQVEIVDPALSPGVRIGSDRMPKLIFALLVGLGLGAVFGFILENYKPVIRRRADLEGLFPVPNLATVPQIHKQKSVRRRLFSKKAKPANGKLPGPISSTFELVTVRDMQSAGAEAYRTLRTNLLFSAVTQSLKRIVVTSAGPSEGKSTTAANLAIAFAQQGRRVLLIDCDLRRPRIHKIFRLPNKPGLTDLLVAKEIMPDVLRPTSVPGLFVIAAGTPPPNPAELLGSVKMLALLDQLGETVDVVVLDTPPLLAVSDAAILGRVSDGTLVVVRAGRSQPAQILEGIEQLEKVGARILGTVLNDPDAEVAKYTPYHHRYYDDYHRYSRTDP